MLIRLLSILLAVGAGAYAQRSDTVSQRVFNNSLSAGPSALIRNIGQSQHLFFVKASDGAGTCSLIGSLDFFIEGSFDGSTFIPISPQTIQLSTGDTPSTWQGYSFANGAYPFLRARYTSHPTNCRIDAWYTGTIPTAPFPQLPKGVSVGYFTSLFRPASAGSFAQISNPTSTRRIVVYGLFLYNPAGTANNVELQYRDATCTGPLNGTVIDVGAFQPYAHVVWPTSIVPYYVGPEGQSLCLTQSAATQINSTVIYRFE